MEATYHLKVADVFDRVDAMKVTSTLWPEEPSPGSGFATDTASMPAIPTYLTTRIQLLEAVRLLQAAAQMVRAQRDVEWGAHMVLLRPALVLTAKAAWIARPDNSDERVSHATSLIIAEQRKGAKAMRDAVAQGAIREFGSVADAFQRTADQLSAAGNEPPTRPPSDEQLIRQLGSDVDRYYGTDGATSDMQILWNASSSLAHGERWYRALTTERRRPGLATILTERSLDVICSGINTTSLRLLWLAATPPPSSDNPAQ